MPTVGPLKAAPMLSGNRLWGTLETGYRSYSVYSLDLGEDVWVRRSPEMVSESLVDATAHAYLGHRGRPDYSSSLFYGQDGVHEELASVPHGIGLEFAPNMDGNRIAWSDGGAGYLRTDDETIALEPDLNETPILLNGHVFGMSSIGYLATHDENLRPRLRLPQGGGNIALSDQNHLLWVAPEGIKRLNLATEQIELVYEPPGRVLEPSGFYGRTGR